MSSALRSSDFRLLFAGQSASSIGDQFHLIALPWLVLRLTHDPLHLGLVLAAAGIPRAALMLVGGAWADRHSPRTIMLVSDVLRFALTAALAAAILTGSARVWMVYVLALAFGIVSGFFMPAAESTVPRLLDTAQLESGNSLIMGSDQLASFLGPVAAGLLIAAFGAGTPTGGESASLVGIGSAFALDAGSFLVSAATAPRPGDRLFSWLVVGLMGGFALAMGSLGFVRSTWLTAALMLATGIGNGYIDVVLISSVQRLTDKRFLGRVMSLIMLAVVGLVPISPAAAGVVLGASPTALFLTSGTGFALLTLAAIVNRSLWTIQGVPTASESGAGLPRGTVTTPA